MASQRSFVEYICEQAREVDPLSFKKMFGEYAIYVGTKVIALVCDDQLFLKPTPAGRALLRTVTEAPPYPGAKPYLQISEVIENRLQLTKLFRATAEALPEPKPKLPKKKD